MNRAILASPGFQGRPWGAGGIVVPGSAPSVGAHASALVGVGVLNDPLVTPSVTTQSGSLLLACVGRGNITNFTSLTGRIPQDNKGNPAYTQVGVTEAYAHPNEASGTALYKLVGATGGAGYQVSVAQGQNGGGNHDEVTSLICEVIGGTVVQDFSWLEDTTAAPTTTGNVTTTAPAVLVSFWWGEGASFSGISVDAGWTVVETQLVASNGIQAALAVRQVSTPGTYNLTWTATPAQGAQMWMVAVQ